MKEIVLKDKLSDLDEYIKACDKLDLTYKITKKNVGTEENKVYAFYLYVDVK